MDTEDIVEVFLKYDPPLSTDADGQVKIKTTFNNSDVNIPIDFNYVQTQYEIQYFRLINVISSIGGVNAFFGPLLNVMTPILGLNFLYKLSEIIKDRID